MISEIKENIKKEVIHLLKSKNKENLFKENLFEIGYSLSLVSEDIKKLETEQPLNEKNFYKVIFISQIIENNDK